MVSQFGQSRRSTTPDFLDELCALEGLQFGKAVAEWEHDGFTRLDE